MHVPLPGIQYNKIMPRVTDKVYNCIPHSHRKTGSQASTTTRTAIMRKQIINVDEDVEKLGASYTAGRNVKCATVVEKFAVLPRVTQRIARDLAILLQGMCPKGPRTSPQQNTIHECSGQCHHHSQMVQITRCSSKDDG